MSVKEQRRDAENRKKVGWEARIALRNSLLSLKGVGEAPTLYEFSPIRMPLD